MARLLLEHGAGINTHSNEFKESALTLACYKGTSVCISVCEFVCVHVCVCVCLSVCVHTYVHAEGVSMFYIYIIM